MSKRIVGVVLAALACSVLAATLLVLVLRDRFLGPPHTPQVKAGPGDKPKPDDPAPDDPAAYRPAPVSLAPASAFLFTGRPPRQFDGDRRALQRRRAAVLRGRVLDAGGKPLAGVVVSAPAQPDVGRTRTDADGAFDLAVNGGGPVVVTYEKEGLLPAWRSAAVPWHDYVWLPDVVLTPPAAAAGVLELPAPAEAAALRGPRVEDGDGPRQPAFIAPPGFAATLAFSDGDKPLGRLTLSATEYTAGPHSAQALPAAPPPGAGCAYAVEVNADEARDPGARGTRFRKPLIEYVEDFLTFPAGAELPFARYDPERGAWLAGAPGRVVRLLGAADGLAELDVDGTGKPANAATLTKLGIDEAERRRLAPLFPKGAALWRLPLTGLGAWAVLPALRPPDGAAPPPYAPAVVGVADNKPRFAPPPGPAAESVAVPGTHLLLCYNSDRAPGTKSLYHMTIPLSGVDVPAGLKRIDLEIHVAGRRVAQHFQPRPVEQGVFDWDGLDAYGRPVPGRWPALVRVGYVYDAAGPGRKQECVLWREQRVMLGDWDARAQALGGWTLNVHHAYDPVGRVLHLGGGGRREGQGLPPVITTVAGGTDELIYNDDDIPATLANLSQPRGLAVGPDGSLYIADAGQNRVRQVGPDGQIATVAGTGRAGFDGDGRPGVETQLNAPAGLALGIDGSLYVADDGNNRVRRLRPDGTLTGFAGRGARYEYVGDGGPAAAAQLSLLRGLAFGPGGDLFIAQNGGEQCVRRVASNGVVTCLLGGPAGKAGLRTANAVAVAPEGTLFVADGDDCRVWRVALDGSASVVAGTGKPGFSGDGGPAVKAELHTPSGLAVGPDGSLYIADARNQRVRRVGPDGVITTFAGGGRSDSHETGDGGPATEAALRLSERPQAGLGRLCGLAVGPDGALYVADTGHSSVRRIAPLFGGISDSQILLPSEDGAELYVFDGLGRHLETLNAATGAQIHRFVYDTAGRLKEVHDAADAVTKIERDKAGRPRAVLAPDGQRTALETGADGRLSRVTFPAGETAEMEYDAGGLLTSFTDVQKNVAHFHYDDGGRLMRE